MLHEPQRLLASGSLPYVEAGGPEDVRGRIKRGRIVVDHDNSSGCLTPHSLILGLGRHLHFFR